MRVIVNVVVILLIDVNVKRCANVIICQSRNCNTEAAGGSKVTFKNRNEDSRN